MANLDDRHRPEHRPQAIVEYDSGTLVALAGPGTGKTRALRKRARELVLNRKIDPTTIAYVTFIRQIAAEFQQSLTKAFKDDASMPDMVVSTLHGLALRLIRNKGITIGKIGHQQPLAIDSNEDLLALKLREDVRALLSRRGLTIGKQMLRSDLREAKREWQRGDHEPAVSKRAEIVLDAFYQLADIYKVLDWDQLPIWARQICDLLDTLPPWLGRIEHFLVDEYQDFNPSEQNLLEYMMSGADSVVITGDDDQSLYSWRGADPARIVALDADAKLDHVNLVYSWRCPAGILGPASRFLQWMRDDPRELLAHGGGGETRAVSFKSAKAEADYLAPHIAQLLDSIPEGADAEAGVACLLATNLALARYKDVLGQRGIACSIPKMVEITDEQRWARILLRLAHLRSQPLLERVLLQLFPPIQPCHQDALVEMLLELECTVREAVSECCKSGKWSEAASAAGADCQSLMQSLTSGEPDEISRCLHSVLGDSAPCTPEMVEQFLEEAKASLEDAVDTLLQRVFDGDVEAEPPGVSDTLELYTMHGAKGLTRAHVILPGCERLWLPSTAATADADEQKRLFYVAVTRARDSVLITHPRTRAPTDPLCRGQVFDREMSPFVEKLGVSVDYVT